MIRTHLIPFLLSSALVISGCSQGGFSSNTSDASSSGNEEMKMHMNLLAGTLSKIGNADGTAAAAMFNMPGDAVRVGSNLYVVDSYNYLIRKIVISTGVVTTFAGNGEAATVDGTGTSASFHFGGYDAITTDGTNLYVAEEGGNTIRKVVISTGVVTTIAGDADNSGSADGTGTAATFDSPAGIATDGTNLYVADFYNSTIRKIVISSKVVTTLAGDSSSTGSADGTGAAATFTNPQGLALNGTDLYVADNGNCTIRKVDVSNGAVTTYAGTAGNCSHNDATGAAALFNYPTNLAITGGRMYVVDAQNLVVRDIDLSNASVSTFAGTAGVDGTTDGTGAAIQFGTYPQGIATDGTNLFVMDTYNSTVRKVVISSAVSSTLAGTPAAAAQGSTDGSGTTARFKEIKAITSDGNYLYVTEFGNHTVRKVDMDTGTTTTLAGSAGNSGSTNGTGAAARFLRPYGIVYTGGNLYVADYGNHLIRKIVASTGVVTTFAGDGTAGHNDGTGTAAQVGYPTGITTDGTNLYVAEIDNTSAYIRKIVISTGVVTTLAGGAFGSANGTGMAARFNWPSDLATDGTNLYIADQGNNLIRKMVLSSQMVTTLAGTGSSLGYYDNTNGATSTFNMPVSLTLKNDSILYVADQGNNTIRKINLSSDLISTIIGIARSIFDKEGALADAITISNPSAIYYDSGSIYVTNDANIKRVR